MADQGLFRADRRTLLKGGVALGAAAALPADAAAEQPIAAQPIDTPASTGDRIWLGPDYWANRLQDWRRSGDWIECLRGEASMEVRTVALLTRELISGGSALIEVDIAADSALGRGGFGGFLIGVGEGRLDPLAAALAQRGSGVGGGMFAVVDCDGRPAFREHVSESAPLAFAELDFQSGGEGAFDLAQAPVRLSLSIEPRGGDRSRLTLEARPHGASGPVRWAVLDGVPDALLRGGVSLVSSPPARGAGARFRFANIATGGAGIAVRPERALGPCLGCLHSIANGVLKLAAHFVLLGKDDDARVILERRERDRGGDWRKADEAEIGDGSVALFRVEDWDASRDWDYRVRYAAAPEALFSGVIRRDPAARGTPIVVAMVGCILSTQHALEDNVISRVVPQERRFGRYQPENFNFPHRDIVDNSIAHDPDFIFVSGDQYYEHNPTRPEKGTPDSKLDTLYRWQQWIVSFRDLVRDRPAVVLVDDHDVLHGNLWGNGGRDAPEQDQNQGGYAWGGDLVRMIYRVHCGHNPDPADPTPVANGLPVSYGAFLYGGVSFAIVEDRKWKTSAVQGEDMDVHRAELLGPRQEAFLAEWKDMHPGAPKVLLTASQWACLQTDPEGRPLLDFDSNGYPPLACRRAVELARDAKCVMISGDQHLPSLVRLGVDRFDDGPVQFTGPAGGTFWQRWFEPAEPLPNQRGGDRNSGDFRDAFGHPLRVLAVANPQISFAEFREHNKGRSQAINDRDLKSEGYGILRIDRAAETFAFECWRWNKGPEAGESGQYPGWPYTLRFDQVATD